MCGCFSKPVVYVKLGTYELGICRIGGAGLANCLFFVSHGVILAHRYGYKLLRPTWERFGFGPILRREVDKRFYFGFFNGLFSLGTVFKIMCLLTRRKGSERDVLSGKRNLLIVDGWWNYLEDMRNEYDLVKDYIYASINPRAIAKVPTQFRNTICIHVRRGDAPLELRVPLEWTIKLLKKILMTVQVEQILLFSDGDDNELADLLKMPNVKRAFFGNAIADIIAMSRAQLVIGSWSTFSWWGAYLGQVPIILPPKNSGNCHMDATKVCVCDERCEIPESFMAHVKRAFV